MKGKQVEKFSNHLVLIYSINHSMPSYRPSFVLAEQAIIDHYLSLISAKVNESAILTT